MVVQVTPAMCQVRHDPPHSYGDCIRACIATVMDTPCEQVPHFADLGASPDEALASVRRWLGLRGFTVASFGFPGSEPISDVMDYMGQANPGVTYLLFGQMRGGGDHVVVCQGGEMVHNPAWVPGRLHTPTTAGHWQIWVVVRV